MCVNSLPEAQLHAHLNAPCHASAARAGAPDAVAAARARREEKNCIHWFRQQAEAQLAGLQSQTCPAGSWTKVTCVKDVKGEVRAATRSFVARARAWRRGSRYECPVARRRSDPGPPRPAQASLSTRKGNKKVAVYDLTLTLSWEGFDAALDETCKGELKLSEFASANDEDEFLCTATVEGKGAAHETLRARAAALRPQVVRVLLDIAAEMTNQ